MQKQKIVMLRGLPGSGKTTYVKGLIAEKPNTYMHINRDALREMFMEPYSKVSEKLAVRARDALIISALENGIIPVIDDTNLNIRRQQDHITEKVQCWMIEQSSSGGHMPPDFEDRFEFEVVDLTGVPLEECIHRDKERGMKQVQGRSVGADVIRRMHNEHLKPAIKPVLRDPNKADAIICDIDGTLALLGDRSPYAQDKYHLDELNAPIADIVAKYRESGFAVLIVSGREGKKEVIQQTKTWLDKNNVEFDALIMRKEADFRNDAVVKQELYYEFIEPNYNVMFCLDDRDRVVRAWRELGLVCLQVAPGSF